MVTRHRSDALDDVLLVMMMRHTPVFRLYRGQQTVSLDSSQCFLDAYHFPSKTNQKYPLKTKQ